MLAQLDESTRSRHSALKRCQAKTGTNSVPHRETRPEAELTWGLPRPTRVVPRRPQTDPLLREPRPHRRLVSRRQKRQVQGFGGLGTAAVPRLTRGYRLPLRAFERAVERERARTRERERAGTRAGFVALTSGKKRSGALATRSRRAPSRRWRRHPSGSGACDPCRARSDLAK
jgi:hypothetical protein